MLTDDQREAAIEAAAWGIANDCGHDPDLAMSERGCGCVACNNLAIAALTALLDAGFIVLHPDDVTEETDVRRYGERWRKQARFVTTWEPIREP